MKRGKGTAALIAVLLIAAAAFMPMDMYISKPGGAYDLTPLVTVQGGDEDDKGTMSLMTIALSKATPLTYVFANFMDSRKIMKAGQVRQDGETEQEYEVRQKKMMGDSQFNAILVAYQKAQKPVDVAFEGVLVMRVLEKAAASGILEPGDIITGLDGETLRSAEEFSDSLSSLGEGEKVRLAVRRDGERLEEEVGLAPIPGGDGRLGLGISFTEERSIETDPEVEIHTEDIGGPSAGLMFTLEIMDRLLDEDLTKGYQVGGTGEMNEDGTVGRIGGIDFKIMAADRDGIEVFFAPDDEITDAMRKVSPGIRSNYEEAAETAKKIGTDMKVVPVKTVDDALEYLRELKQKK
ncbi:SepM family pheromone-processing serine protease [Edaphobacillus lindanitolerans]|uniref:endopeptidase La n=1 Tax=Edaphobacillus lindanitolerans TaxID=550447 RepID=A0A1U7PL81_9BACI|nr:SepM family pheromone-processing serine protease [Edaphobacillus lindanitolerans]SIT67954.1 PDZ domain-containing protein [Edaphobacillus lindanitolerans]